MERMLVALLLIISMKGLHDGGLANLGLMLCPQPKTYCLGIPVRTFHSSPNLNAI